MARVGVLTMLSTSLPLFAAVLGDANERIVKDSERLAATNESPHPHEDLAHEEGKRGITGFFESTEELAGHMVGTLAHQAAGLMQATRKDREQMQSRKSQDRAIATRLYPTADCDGGAQGKVEGAALVELLAVAFDRSPIDPEASGCPGPRDAFLHRLDESFSEIQLICTRASGPAGAPSSQSTVRGQGGRLRPSHPASDRRGWGCSRVGRGGYGIQVGGFIGEP